MYYVYVLRNPDGLLYKGHTSDLNERIEQHNDPERPHSYTRNKGPWTLVHKEEHATRAEAMRREKFLKSGKGREVLKAIIQ